MTASMLHEPARHEVLERYPWDELAAAHAIERIVRDAEHRFSPERHWPLHPLDAGGGRTAPELDLYGGAGGVAWALHYLEAAGAVELRRSYDAYVDALLPLNRRSLKPREQASFLVGDTGLLLLGYRLSPSADKAARLEELIAGNLDHPARDLMWGTPGTMLAALFMHQRTREPRWAELYVASARRLRSDLEWSDELECRYWSQVLGGHRSTYLGGVHGFAATASAIIRGRHLLDPAERDAWEQCIVETVRNTAQREGDRVNWLPCVYPFEGEERQAPLMQFCHGAPGIVVCTADLPAEALDDDLLAGGEAIWAAGPLKKGSNLCHGTGGNGYAFLKLYARTKDERWLARARAFAMHGLVQMEAHARQYGQLRYSLWTGDLGFAIYLRDCIRGTGAFPTLETFLAQPK